MDELERFKRDINLAAYAASRGYQVERRESSRSSLVMRHPATDDKVIVSRGEGGHWTYFSVRDDADNGSIIDFVQRRQRMTLGQVRKELRLFSGLPEAERVPDFARGVEALARDRAHVARAWAAAQEPQTSRYLNARGIRPETLQDVRFRGTWREDSRGNVLFAHRDPEGLSGFEMKNVRFTGFSAHGSKAVWHSHARAGDTHLVLTESAIDALSYHQLHPSPSARYMSTGGALSPHQREVLQRAIAKMPEGSTVVLGFDADEGGQRLAQEVALLAPGANLVRHVPTQGKDWNDVLQHKERDYIRAQRALASPERDVGP